MKDLIALWIKRADKYERMGRASSGLNQEGLLSMAAAIWICVGELKREIAKEE